jgi:hypothetical protein
LQLGEHIYRGLKLCAMEQLNCRLEQHPALIFRQCNVSLAVRLGCFRLPSWASYLQPWLAPGDLFRSLKTSSQFTHAYLTSHTQRIIVGAIISRATVGAIISRATHNVQYWVCYLTSSTQRTVGPVISRVTHNVTNNSTHLLIGQIFFLSKPI